MKILIASDQYWPMVSGCATAGRNLASGLAEAGHEVLVIAPSQTGRPYDEVDRNYRVVRTRSVPIPTRENMRMSVTLQTEIRKIIAAFEPDLVHVHTQFMVGIATLRQARKLDIPVVATNHLMPQNIIDNVKFLTPLNRPVSYIIREYGPLLYKGAEYIIMPTQGAIDMFKPDAYGGVPVTAVSNGIDLSQSSPGPVPAAFLRRFGIPDDRPVVTYLGRLDGEKHIDVLLRALARVLPERPVHGLIVGAGNEAEGLQKLATSLGIAEHVTFTGRVSDDDRLLMHRVGTLYVMPSPAELQSLSTLEAMASGQPIVAVRMGVLAELCHDGENGFMFKLDDDADLARCITKIVTNPKLRAEMSRESLRIAQTHELGHVIRRFEEIYESVIAHHAYQPAKSAR